jgi:predicted amidohydrolase YtcJ
VTVMAAGAIPAPLSTGPVKLLLDEYAGFDIDATVAAIAEAHRAGRPIAIHCVTRAETVSAVAAIEAAGPLPGDRLEHASVAPFELDPTLRRLGITVVTQPNFIAERADEYLANVTPEDLGLLYRIGTMRAAGIGVAGGTDAPFGRPDTWSAMRAAVERRGKGGGIVGPAERLFPETALALFLGQSRRPAMPTPRLVPDIPADLCLLDRGLSEALVDLDGSAVRLTIVGGIAVFER